MGGSDPYSSSKGGRRARHGGLPRFVLLRRRTGPRVASARAGNVIGGGDWGEDRLIADLVRAAERREPIRLRNPDAVRPWQHVLNPLHGYLLLGAGAHPRRGVCRRTGTSAPTSTTPDRSASSPSAWPSCGRAGSAGPATTGLSRPRRRTWRSTPRAPASGSAGGPDWDLEQALVRIVDWQRDVRRRGRHATRDDDPDRAVPDMSPLALRRYRAERLLRRDFHALRPGVVGTGASPARGARHPPRRRRPRGLLRPGVARACTPPSSPASRWPRRPGWLVTVTVRRAIDEHRQRAARRGVWASLAATAPTPPSRRTSTRGSASTISRACERCSRRCAAG